MLNKEPPLIKVCEFCDGHKFFRYDVPLTDDRFGRLFPCPKCNQPAVNAACGLNERERSITLENIDDGNGQATKIMKRAAVRFISSPVGFLSIFGTCGNAKTVVLQSIVNSCVVNGIEARYLTAHELLDYLKEAFDPKVLETDIARIRRLASIPVLCIDELDKAKNTEWAADMQHHLIDERYRNAHRLGTVFAWNGNLETLPWPAIISRMSEFPCIANTDADVRPAIGRAKL